MYIPTDQNVLADLLAADIAECDGVIDIGNRETVENAVFPAQDHASVIPHDLIDQIVFQKDRAELRSGFEHN